MLIDKDTLEMLKDAYYDMRGWDRATGIPTPEKLNELDLEEITADLWRFKIISAWPSKPDNPSVPSYSTGGGGLHLQTTSYRRVTMTYADKPWLKSYKLGPYKLDHSLAPYPEEPVYKALDDAAESYPGQTAILYLDRKISYRQLKLLSEKLAAALQPDWASVKGDRVCVFLPNCPEFIISDWAIMKAGAAMVPTST